MQEEDMTHLCSELDIVKKDLSHVQEQNQYMFERQQEFQKTMKEMLGQLLQQRRHLTHQHQQQDGAQEHRQQQHTNQQAEQQQPHSCNDAQDHDSHRKLIGDHDIFNNSSSWPRVRTKQRSHSQLH
jgi:hypothetical protein